MPTAGTKEWQQAGDNKSPAHASSQRLGGSAASQQNQHHGETDCQNRSEVPGETQRLLGELGAAKEHRQFAASEQAYQDVALSQPGVHQTQSGDQNCGHVQHG